MKLFTAGIMVLTSLTLSAATYRLNYNGNNLMRGNSKILLKQELKKSYPSLRVNQLELKRVTLVAKSAKGNATAKLKVGNFTSREEIIDGNRRDFNSKGQFHRINFESPRRDKGAWQVLMKGNIKVKAIIIRTDDARRPGNDNNRNVTRTCQFRLEFFWGDDISTFSARATGPRGSGVLARACQKAQERCEAARFPATQCSKL